MGSWGFRTFEDDIACDWLEDLHDSDPIAFFKQCLDLRGLDCLEFLACVGVVCTAEILHGIVREPRAGLPEVAHLWFQEHEDLGILALIPEAVSGLQRVLDPNSEMYQLWEDNPELHGSWVEHQRQLVSHLQAAMIEKA